MCLFINNTLDGCVHGCVLFICSSGARTLSSSSLGFYLKQVHVGRGFSNDLKSHMIFSFLLDLLKASILQQQVSCHNRHLCHTHTRLCCSLYLLLCKSSCHTHDLVSHTTVHVSNMSCVCSLSWVFLMLQYKTVSYSTGHFKHYEGSVLRTLFLWHIYPVLVHFLFTQLRVHSAATYYPYTKHKSRLGILNFYKPVTIMLSAKNIIQLLVFFSFAY